jgi:molybdopterin synthase sulfur carrier subunit
MIRIILPAHLRTLSRVTGDVMLEVAEPLTLGAVLDAIEATYPMLRGTIRDHGTKKRRDFIRFFACGEDWSDESYDTLLPDSVRSGTQSFRIVGALAGG